jgi:CRISPR-associated protein Cmr1
MKREPFSLELITPGFCGGAEPDQRAEIRASSIRGQLRWWFRVLGGFQFLQPKSAAAQEALIFGSTAGDEGTAGMLRLQISHPVQSTMRMNAEDLEAGMNTDLGYALFPLRQFDSNDGKRGLIPEGTQFTVILTWRGDPGIWESLNALMTVWSNFGSLGFRSRRTMGAIRATASNQSITSAMNYFSNRSALQIKTVALQSCNGWRPTAGALLKWFRSWRQHGQMNQTWAWADKKNRQLGGKWTVISTQQKKQNRAQIGFKYARRDHNEGLQVQGTLPPNPDPENPHGGPGQTFRPALGLPIIQFFSSLGGPNGPIRRNLATVNWEESTNSGRFASPVLLRPHKDAQGKWHALVIFVDSMQWPAGKQVYLNGQPREVSPDLYEAMKADPNLHPFP